MYHLVMYTPENSDQSLIRRGFVAKLSKAQAY